MRKKVITFFLVATLLLSNLAACAPKEAVKYTINFDSNGGSAVETIEYTTGESINFSVPMKKGYQFIGWYNNAQFAGNPYFVLPTDFTGNKTLYAGWNIAEYKIKYNLPVGATIPVGSAEKFSYFNSEGVENTDSVQLATTVTRNGYTFDGWYANADFSGKKITVVPAGTCADFVVYPKFNTISYVITFNTNCDQVIENDSFNASENKVIKEPVAREFYTFGGWYASSDFAGNPITFIAKNSKFSDITLYAKWIGEKFAIEYVLDGGSFQEGENYPKTYTFDGNVQLVSPSKEGAAFVGWFDNAQFSGNSIVTIPAGQSGKKTFYAKWLVSDFSIKYTLNGGSFSGQYPQGYNKGDTIDLVSPRKEGYTFAGWYDNPTFANSTIVQIVATDNENKQLYAKWEVTNYTISFNLNGGSFANESRVSFYNITSQTISLITNDYTPTKLGYKFNGWFTTSDFTTQVVNTIPSGSTGNKTFYAKFDIITYKLTYQLGGGSLGTNPMVYSFNVTTAIALPAVNPTRTGYSFDGWFNNGSFTEANTVGLVVGTIGDRTIYAKWAPKTYAINYNSDGGKLPDGAITSYAYGTLTFLPVPTKSGKDFGGWYTTSNPTASSDGKLGSLVAKTIGDKTLYALWLDPITEPKSKKMEAENTNLEGKVGSGGSGSAQGSELISSSYPTASNGQCIPWTWAPGISIEWEFNLDRAVSDSTIEIALGNEIGSEVTFTNETTSIKINGKEYSAAWSIAIPDKKFKTLTINLSADNMLYAGYNVISIEILPNNLSPGIEGYGPIFDCITLNSKANITWTPIIWKE